MAENEDELDRPSVVDQYQGTDRTESRKRRISSGILSVAATPRRVERDQAALLLRTLVSVQFLWMVLSLVILYMTDTWSPENYFIVSLFGLLSVRLLFAPPDEAPVWWRALNWLTYGCLLLLASIVLQDLTVPLA